MLEVINNILWIFCPICTFLGHIVDSPVDLLKFVDVTNESEVRITVTAQCGKHYADVDCLPITATRRGGGIHSTMYSVACCC